MKATVDNARLTAQLAAELVTPAPSRPRRVNYWVNHFFGCSICRKPNTSFPVESKPRNELCEPGRKLLDNWLDED
jgi:hypothetical protein